jgi:hypothetical protein
VVDARRLERVGIQAQGQRRQVVDPRQLPLGRQRPSTTVWVSGRLHTTSISCTPRVTVTKLPGYAFGQRQQLALAFVAVVRQPVGHQCQLGAGGQLAHAAAAA